MKNKLVVLLVVIGTFGLVAGCGVEPVAEAEVKENPVQVETTSIETVPMPQFLDLTGSLVAHEQADVAANASGRVTKTYVERGSIVRTGDPLVQLDTRTVQQNKVEADADLDSARAEKQLADGQCERNSRLFEKGVISRDEWEQIEKNCRAAESSAKAADARAQLAQISLADSTVRVPFDGRIQDRQVSVGEYVQPSSVIASLVQTSPLRLVLSISEKEIGRIQVGGEVTFQVQAFPDETFSGTVTYISPAVREETRDVVFEAQVPNENGRLKPGMFATARLHLADAARPAIPLSAIREQDGVARVFLVVGEHAEERIVQLGVRRNGFAVIESGAEAGDRYITEPTEQIQDGVAIAQENAGR